MSLLVTEVMKINFTLKSHDFSILVLAKWILSQCLDIHTLKVVSPKQWYNFHNEMGRLKKLKKLDVLADEASQLKEVTLIASRIMTMLFTSS
jgi:hypothetical protein